MLVYILEAAFSQKIFSKGRIRWFPSNQSVCRVIQYALLITIYSEDRYSVLSALSEILSTFTDKPISRATFLAIALETGERGQ